MRHQRSSRSEKSEQGKGKHQDRSQDRMQGQQREDESLSRWQDRDEDKDYQDQGYRAEDYSRFSRSDRNMNMETNQRPGWGREFSGEETSYGGGRGYYDEGSYGSQQGVSSQRGSRSEAQGRYAGRGPKGYTRSDERIKEEISEALTRDHEVDASDIEIEVKDGEVTLTGFVPERKMKHSAEDLIEKCMGVKDITNNLRIQKEEGRGEAESERGEKRGAGSQASKKSGSTSTSSLSH
ncbi:MAG TPA: BON domain-containing protein [Pseudobdellovibrionaceae bacterium]|jgi:osmotically-inducible protein OsmY